MKCSRQLYDAPRSVSTLASFGPGHTRLYTTEPMINENIAPPQTIQVLSEKSVMALSYCI